MASASCSLRNASSGLFNISVSDRHEVQAGGLLLLIVELDRQSVSARFSGSRLPCGIAALDGHAPQSPESP